MLRLSRASRDADRKVVCVGGGRVACGLRARAPVKVFELGARLKTKAESALSPFLLTFPAISMPRQMHDLLFAVTHASVLLFSIFIYTRVCLTYLK